MKNIRQKVTELYISLVITLLSISFWSVCVLYFRPLYHWAVSLFHLESSSGFSKDKILANYNALIDYNVPWVKGKLSLPSLPQSQNAIQHFAEVKDIFNLLIFMIPVTLVLLLLYLLVRKSKGDLHFLKTASITMIVAPLILGSGFVINFEKTFTLFHKLFFDNDYWLFDANTDPIITILPEGFFMMCGIVIIMMQFLTSLGCYVAYRRWYRQKNACQKKGLTI